MSELWGDKEDPWPIPLGRRFLDWCDGLACSCDGMGGVMALLGLVLGYLATFIYFNR